MSTEDARPLRVLCMEDDPGLARLLQKRLERTGHRVDVAVDGEEGLAQYEAAPYDVLVIDQRMPVHTGLDVMRILAERGPLPPIIMVTGTGSEQIAVEAMKLGARDYLVKDVDLGYLDLLPSVIENVRRQVRLEEEKARAEEALRQYASELEDRNEELDAFAHSVAHDLKRPLQLMSGYAYVLKNEYASDFDELGRECVQTIVRSVDTMGNIIDSLLLLASVRREEIDAESLAMGGVVERALTRLDPLIDKHRAHVTAPDSWPVALGYGPWVEEVWVNYISNAIKYGGKPDDEVPPRVELGHDDGADQVRFWVRDNGRGLTEDQQQSLFVPFTRLEQARIEGHGLGLSIVRRIVKKLGGDVGVESEVGRGSTFHFTLPSPY